MATLHPHQKALFDLLKRRNGNINDLSLRDMGVEIGIGDKAQVVAHHLEQLEKKGFIRRVAPNVKRFEVLANPAPEVVYIDLFKATAQCGPEGFLGSDEVIDRIPLSSKTFGINNPDDFFLIRPRGTSMEPMIKEGDLVLARKQNDVESGQIAVIVHEGMPKIKKVMKIEVDNEQRYLLKSLNSQFDDETVVNENSGLIICGQVKGVLKVS